MKRILSLALVVVAGAMTFDGCGDSGPSEPVNVYLEFKVGDLFTYNYYTRDSTNQRVDASKQVRKWSVINTNATGAPGRTNVTAVQEIVFDGTGTTEQYRDTLFFSSTGQGKVEQYDIVGNLLGLISFASQYKDSVAPVWVQIGDVKTSGGLTWASFPTPLFVPNVEIPFAGTTVKATITLTMSASHKGRADITALAGTFTNNFHTDHSLKFKAEASGLAVTDSIPVHYDIDTGGGIVKTSADSKAFNVFGTAFNVPGYEMELVSVTRVQ